ncbi:hypothetical protein EKK58_04360 [Candidatus Dependentiae bacterium]|nr:MAG: hypothetical protein EKK58_04360 [Candidatus Dependentiae bacterium]
MSSQKNIEERSEELVINIVASKDNQDAKMDCDNSFFQERLLNKKLILTFAQLDNTAVPLFIPKKLNEIPSYVGTLISDYDTININSLSYIIAMNNTNNINTAKWAILQWSPVNPLLVSPSSLLNQKQVYSTPYYYSYNITHFLKILENGLINLYNAVHGISNGTVQVVYDGKNISVVIPEQIGATDYPTYFWINSDLRDLLRINNYKISNANDMYISVPDITKVIDGNRSSLYNSRFISREWVAFDTILITTSLPIKSVEYQTMVKDTNSASTEYRNVIFALNTLTSSVNFYPFYEYTPSTTDLFKTFTQNTFDQTSFSISLYLYDKRNGLSIPYKLNKNELITLDFLIKKIN